MNLSGKYEAHYAEKACYRLRALALARPLLRKCSGFLLRKGA
jgi:hypothetical protein